MSHRRPRVTAERFYNLPGDEELEYPKFCSFQQREIFIRGRMLQSEEFLERLQRIVAEDTARAGGMKAEAQPLEQIPGATPGLAPDPADPGMIQTPEDFAALAIGPPNPVLDLDDHKSITEVVFVGDSTTLVSPRRGDLIISPPKKNVDLSEKGYVTSYEGPGTHWFEHGELLLRIGNYEEVKAFFDSIAKINNIDRGLETIQLGDVDPTSHPTNKFSVRHKLFLHRPHRNLELYQYNRDRSWKHLGSQVAMANTEIPIDTSPGKYLKVSAPITSIDKFKPLVPRRGDVVIKREAWKESFLHRENFWRSMVKWQRDRKLEWNPDDLLIRLFVDKEKCPPCGYVSDTTPEPGDHSACYIHGICKESHPPPSSGFAELYAYREGKVGWVYWGRTELLFDIPSTEERDPHLLLYVQDDGQFSDFEFDEEEKMAQVPDQPLDQPPSP